MKTLTFYQALHIVAFLVIALIAKVTNKENIHDGNIREITKLNIRQVKQKKQWGYQKTNFNLLCYTQTPTKLNIGDKIRLKNISFSSPHSSQNLSGNMNFKNYLLKENVLATIFTRKLWYKRFKTSIIFLNCFSYWECFLNSTFYWFIS